MTVSITVIELIWVALNLSTFVLTVAAYIDARADRKAVKALNGHARELAANGIVRREGLRLIVQALLVAAVLPLALDDRPVRLSVTIVFLMAVPLVLLLSTIFDARDRRAMGLVVAGDILAEREDSYQRYKTEHDAIVRDPNSQDRTGDTAKGRAIEVFEAAKVIHDAVESQAAEDTPPA